MSPRAPKQCGNPSCTNRVPGGTTYCTSCRSQRRKLEDAGRPSRQDRGYGPEHEAERARWEPIVAAGRVHCWRCGKPIRPATEWDLGHDDHDRTRYRGPEHVRCNRGRGRHPPSH